MIRLFLFQNSYQWTFFLSLKTQTLLSVDKAIEQLQLTRFQAKKNNNDQRLSWMRSYSFLIVSSCFSGVNIWQAVSVNITLINHHLSLLNDRFELITISWPICVLISSSSAWLDKNLNICKFFYAILYLAITAVGNTKKRLRFIYPFFLFFLFKCWSFVWENETNRNRKA